jgi:hypothetical protein
MAVSMYPPQDPVLSKMNLVHICHYTRFTLILFSHVLLCLLTAFSDFRTKMIMRCSFPAYPHSPSHRPPCSTLKYYVKNKRYEATIYFAPSFCSSSLLGGVLNHPQSVLFIWVGYPQSSRISSVGCTYSVFVTSVGFCVLRLTGIHSVLFS